MSSPLGADPRASHGPGLDAVRSLPIFKPVEGHLHEVPFFLTREMFGGLPIELAGGDISALVGKPVADAHVHACDEIYFLIAPEPGAAVIDVEVDGLVSTFESPATILVPAGARHRFVTRRASTGSYCFGIFVPRQMRAVRQPMTEAGAGATASTVSTVSTASFNAATIDSPADVRLHLSESPHPFTPAVRAAVLAELDRGQLYPDPESTVLRERVARFYDLDPSMVVVGNGCDELVLLSALALVGPRGRGVTTAATFPGYRTAMSLLDAAVTEVPLRDHRCDLEALASAAAGSAAVYLCNPHNPTGSAASRQGLRRFLEATSAAGAVPVVDEAYLELAGEGVGSAVDFIREGGPAIALRTMSKAYGLAGMRVGIALGSAALIARLTRAAWALPFRVNRMAQMAALAALEDQAQLRETCRELRATKDSFYRGLEELGLTYLPSETNFVMVRTPRDSAETTRCLRASHHLLVRDCGPFGLPGWIRISMGSPSDMSRALAVLCEER